MTRACPAVTAATAGDILEIRTHKKIKCDRERRRRHPEIGLEIRRFLRRRKRTLSAADAGDQLAGGPFVRETVAWRGHRPE